MSILTPEQKRSHFENRRKSAANPEPLLPDHEITGPEISAAIRRIHDEITLCRRLYRASATNLLSAQRYSGEFASTAKTLRASAAQHRRLWWYAAFAAVRELGSIIAATNGGHALSHDEAGADLDVDARRLLEWLVDEGRKANNRRKGR